MILDKTVMVKWSNNTRKWYEDKGYIFTKTGDKYEVKTEDLSKCSRIRINIKCDNDDCQKVFNIAWHNYKEYLNHKHLCHSCASKFRFCQIEKSLYDWCLENNRQDILDRWDYDTNKINPKDISSTTKNKYWFKCLINEKHHSEQFEIDKITLKNNQMVCKQCISFAQWLLDTYGEHALKLYWDYEKNIGIDPWKLTCMSKQNVWIKCQEKDYHESYKIMCMNFTTGHRCPYCSGHKVHPLDSLGTLYPQVFEVWSAKNKKSPYDYMPNSGVKVWWKCPDGKHEEFKRSIRISSNANFRCPQCNLSNGEKRISDWLKINNYYKIVQKEYNELTNENKQIQKYYIGQKKFNGLLGVNNGLLSYDFYLPNQNLLIEYQGIQHKQPVDFLGLGLANSKCQFGKQIEHDRRKKQYCIDNNIKLLEIWYWDYDNIESILDKELHI